jgi:hypothetical protein
MSAQKPDSSRLSPQETDGGMASRSRYRIEYQRGHIPREVKAHVWNFTWGRCWYCGTNYLNPFENLVIEHIVPLCRGGSDDIENLVPACAYCNQAKGTLLLEEWRAARPIGNDPDDYPFLREFLDSDGPGVLTGRFWFERDPLWVNMRETEIAVCRRMGRCRPSGGE